MLEAIRIPLPKLVRGESLTPDVSLGEGVSTGLQAMLAKAEKPFDVDENEDASTEGDFAIGASILIFHSPHGTDHSLDCERACGFVRVIWPQIGYGYPCCSFLPSEGLFK